MINNIAQNIDCMEAMKRYPDKWFELAVVDPPYGIEINMNMGRKAGKRKKHKQKVWDNEIPEDAYFEELMRVSKNQIIWGGNYFPLPLTKSWLFWDKLVPDAMSFAAGELAWTSFNESLRKITLDSKSGNRIHPTQKPVSLYKWLLTNYAKQGDKILDTHLGSGSSRIAAYDLGFDFTGFELDKDYFEAQEKRFQNHIAQGQLFTPQQTNNIINNQTLF